MPGKTPVLILHGNDEFALTLRLEKLRAQFDSSTAEMNISRLDGRALDFEQLNTAINALPFLCSRRLIVLSSSSSLPRQPLLDLLEHVPPTTEVVLVEYELLKPEHWLIKWAHQQKEKASVEVYVLPRRWEMPRWIEKEAARQGGSVEAEAAMRLAELTGEDTRLAAQEITKLLTYVDFQRPITLADVEKVGVVGAQSNVFELVDALAVGEGRKAQKALHRLLEEVAPLELWGMIIRQFRLLLQAREILDEGGNVTQMQKELLLYDFVAQKLIAQARRFSLPVLETIYRRFLEVDEAAKTSQMPLEVALDTLIVQLTADVSDKSPVVTV